MRGWLASPDLQTGHHRFRSGILTQQGGLTKVSSSQSGCVVVWLWVFLVGSRFFATLKRHMIQGNFRRLSYQDRQVTGVGHE